MVLMHLCGVCLRPEGFSIQVVSAQDDILVSRWEFPKIGGPSIVPQIVGSFLQGTPNKVP